MSADGDYSLSIVGESHYQSAIARCIVGEPVRLRLEPQNPYDARAIAVVAGGSEVIGYLPRESFLHRYIWDENRRFCRTQIEAVTGGTSEQPTRGVLVRVTLDTEPDTSVFTLKGRWR